MIARDPCSLLAVSGGWPIIFLPSDEYAGSAIYHWARKPIILNSRAIMPT